jgi:acyl-coenzyme A synthetase/AMP-(fatty) acid ligase
MANLAALFMAGERLDPDTLAWAQAHVGVRVYDHYWQVGGEGCGPYCVLCQAT